MLHLLSRRPPFSDWLAQIERAIARSGEHVLFDRQAQGYLWDCYQCGLSVGEIAAEYMGVR